MVDEIDVCNGDDTLVGIILEVKPRLLQPFKVRHRFDVKFDELVEYVALVDVYGDEGLELRAVELTQIWMKNLKEIRVGSTEI